MPRKIENTGKAHLISVPLPNHAASYTVISHQFIIDYAFQSLTNAGFGIVDEEYRCTADGQIAQGIYKLNFNNDPELSMMFAWTNSYNKQVKFKCVVGAYINNTGSVMISGEVGSWVRKHTGTADTEVKSTIDDYISNAHMYYNQLCSDKAAMEVVTLNRRKQSQLLGVLFAEYEILTTEQASMIRDQMKRPQQVFNNTDSLWAFYNYVTNALQSSHPKTWMEDQRILHFFIGTICDFSAPPQAVTAPVINLSAPVDPLDDNYGEPENQTNLLVQIAEVTGDESVLAPQQIFDLEQSEVSDNQVVQEEVEIDTVLHQSEEIILDITDTNEAQEVISLEPTPEDYEQFNAEEILEYTDPIGNTFEAPIVDKTFNEELSEAISQKFETEAEEFVWGKEVKLDIVDLNETTKQAVIVEENLDNAFAQEDNFDLDFTSNSEEDEDSVPDFF